MSTLHQIQCCDRNVLINLANLAGRDDGILLYGRSIHLASACAELLPGLPVYARERDFTLLSPERLTGVRPLSDAQWIELCLEYDKTLTWNAA